MPDPDLPRPDLPTTRPAAARFGATRHAPVAASDTAFRLRLCAKDIRNSSATGLFRRDTT
ncbi:hypothetical protein [Pseudophaeobacter sp.]|uniref:hypothetical protein n=1 Tax=Pseudophaeobacter sp. TaxID=1971739 RepID=UPI0032969FFA